MQLSCSFKQVVCCLSTRQSFHFPSAVLVAFKMVSRSCAKRVRQAASLKEVASLFACPAQQALSAKWIILGALLALPANFLGAGQASVHHVLLEVFPVHPTKFNVRFVPLVDRVSCCLGGPHYVRLVPQGGFPPQARWCARRVMLGIILNIRLATFFHQKIMCTPRMPIATEQSPQFNVSNIPLKLKKLYAQDDSILTIALFMFIRRSIIGLVWKNAM